jgi:hypothetical protein
MPKFLVKQGINYPPNKRAEPGDVVDDLPKESLAWLKRDGVVEDVSALKPAELRDARAEAVAAAEARERSQQAGELPEIFEAAGIAAAETEADTDTVAGDDEPEPEGEG